MELQGDLDGFGLASLPVGESQDQCILSGSDVALLEVMSNHFFPALGIQSCLLRR